MNLNINNLTGQRNSHKNEIAEKVKVSSFELSELNDVLRVRLHIANKDAFGNLIVSKFWVDSTLQLFSQCFGGAALLPAVEGCWINPDTQETIFEQTQVVETLTSAEALNIVKPRIEVLIQNYALSTGQGEVLLEVGTSIFKYSKFSRDLN